MDDVESMFEGVLDTDDLELGKFMEADFQTLLTVFEKHINQNRRDKLRSAFFSLKVKNFPTKVNLTGLR